MYFLADKSKTWEKEAYCISYVEDGSEYWQEYYVCNDKAGEVYTMMINYRFIPILLSLSMIFLVLTFGLLYMEQKEQLFGSVKS